MHQGSSYIPHVLPNDDRTSHSLEAGPQGHAALLVLGVLARKGGGQPRANLLVRDQLLDLGIRWAAV